ncbi:dephospho-CoA kinase [Ensifer soli]|uniref:dephospho-CoA kinase n=1 Tax=Ciceribacter sp. sgz301302 TaxID=3342379 RepID=UPI0035B9FD42
MIVLGLTGSIGTGKTTTAALFAERGVPVHDADQAVHALYAGAAVQPVEAAFPGVVCDGVVDRALLSRRLAAEPHRFAELERMIHPLVRARETAFLDAHRAAGAPLVLLDIPLLFETGAEARVDRVVVVTCDPAIQRQRVLARPGMTAEKFALVLGRQMADRDKCARADYIIDTGRGMDAARARVDAILRDLDSEGD